jgi:glycerol-3-phosphate dehydrogenase
MLHSGARYAVNDPESAKECFEENKLLSKIAPHVIVDTGGLFVGLSEEETSYKDSLMGGCEKIGIPFQEIPIERVLWMEPKLNSKVKSAIWVPDKVIYAHDLTFSAALTASDAGAKFYTDNEVVELLREGPDVVGVKTFDKTRKVTQELRCRLVINAAGPWAPKIAQMAGLDVAVIPTAGVMGVVHGRLCNRILNRMRPPSDADILIPYGENASVMGTTAMLIEDPDNIDTSDEDLELLLREGSEMVPELRTLGFSRAYASARPLIKLPSTDAEDVRQLGRDLQIFNHELQGTEGIMTIAGGKLTTARLMGERISDLAAKKLGINQKCKTREKTLLGVKPDQDAEQLAKASGLELSFVRRILETIGSVDEERFMPAIRLLLSYCCEAN